MPAPNSLRPPLRHDPIERFTFDEIDGTNAFGTRWIKLAKAAGEAVILSQNQTAGRGQHGRDWSTSAGEDLAWSYVRRFEPETSIESDALVSLNKAWTLATLGTLRRYLSPDQTLGIKWPNDLFLLSSQGWRKLGGILIETSWRGSHCQGIVLGIGVNLNSHRAHAPGQAISILDACGLTTDLASLSRDLEEAIRNAWPNDSTSDEFNENLLFRGEKRLFNVSGEPQTGVFLGALENGMGQFQWETRRQEHAQGEVTWIW